MNTRDGMREFDVCSSIFVGTVYIGVKCGMTVEGAKVTFLQNVIGGGCEYSLISSLISLSSTSPSSS